MPSLPLAGIRVLDLGQMIAVPFATQALGWLGAEVVLVENPKGLGVRTLPPFAEAQPGLTRSGGFNLLNTNKSSVTLDLSKPGDLQKARELVAVSDVLTENFSTGTLEKLGLDYASVRRMRPDIIFLSQAAFGRSGPLKDFAGFHSVVNLFSGVAATTGYPGGGHPRMLGGFAPDFIGGNFCLLVILEALYHRAQTGEGQFVEVSMTEAMSTLIPQAVADYAMHRREPQRVGNRDEVKTPHGVFRCLGKERWVAISVAGDDQWRALCWATGHPEWATNARFKDREARKKNEDALEGLIEAWTARRHPEQVVELLQAAGVASGVVFDAGSLVNDGHLQERGFITSITHPDVGSRVIGGAAWMVNGHRPTPTRPAPAVGEHNKSVFGDLLGLKDEGVA